MSKDDLVREEHEAVRNNVGYYDFTHKMCEIEGPDAVDFVNEIYVAPLDKSKVGQAKYTTMLNEDGEIIDDVIVFRTDDDKFKVSTLFIDELLDWLTQHKGDLNIEFKDVTPENEMFAVQGPNSRAVLDALLDTPVDDLKYFETMPNSIGDIDVTIARSGYTGELGYEIYCDPTQSEMVEEKLVEAGKSLNMKNITTDVIIGSLPREKGFVLMSDLQGTNPLEVGFDWTVGWNKDFIGKENLEKVKEEGAKRQLLGFIVGLEDAEVEPDDIVYVNEEPVGKVTLYTYGYTLGKNIGFALVETEKANIGDVITIGDNKIPAILTERMFYDPTNSRIRS